MRIAFGSDDPRHPSVVAWQEHLTERGHEVIVVAEGAEWPEAGAEVGGLVATGAADAGVACCWTGTGVSIAANKVPGVRAALCTDASTADGARRWNDANVVALGLRLTSVEVGVEVLDAFLEGRPDPDEAEAIARVEAGRDLVD